MAPKGLHTAANPAMSKTPRGNQQLGITRLKDLHQGGANASGRNQAERRLGWGILRDQAPETAINGSMFGVDGEATASPRAGVLANSRLRDCGG